MLLLEQRLNYQITSGCFGKNNDFVFFGGIEILEFKEKRN